MQSISPRCASCCVLLFILFQTCGVYSQSKLETNPGIYVLTNKTHYLSGERIWVSAFLFDTAGFGLLRKTHPLYLQLYAPNGNPVSTEILYTQNGRGFGHLDLDASWRGGLYRLRACTRDSRAAGKVYERVISLRRYDEDRVAQLPAPVPAAGAAGLKIAVQMGKATYSLREKVTLSIRVLHAQTRRPVQGAFSLLVSDTSVFQKSSFDILHAVGLPSQLSPAPESEEGLCLEGRIINGKTKAPFEQAELLMMVHDSLRKFSRTASADSKGRFRLSNLPLEGEADISFQINNRKGKPLGNALIEWKTFPPADKLPPLEGATRPVSRAQLDAALFVLRQPEGTAFQDAVLLEEITVEDKKTPKSDFDLPPGVSRLHGRPNFAIDFDDKSPRFSRVRDMLIMLPGVTLLQRSDENTPGDGPCSFAIRMRGVNHAAPMFLVDGLEVDQQYLCESINPNKIIRIEVLDGAAAGAYGQGAAGGVIAFYQRGLLDGDEDDARATRDSQLKGYQPDKPFYMPDYGDPALKSGSHTDQRRTLCWMPEIVTDERGYAEISFYTGDLPGRYRVLVEGMTHGAAGQGENILTVEKN